MSAPNANLISVGTAQNLMITVNAPSVQVNFVGIGNSPPIRPTVSAIAAKGRSVGTVAQD